MTTIYLIRHAEAEGNLYRRIHGWYDSLITDNGFRQIKALEERFRDIHVDAAYSSDLYRTMTTGRAVWQAKGLELHTAPDLREVHLGDWEDRPWGYVRHFHPEEMTAFNRSD
ncbi:MAG: histidine phosphatase family protein, partial [Clostridium sp.]|nr:histidine phosphatase family protein [Clostridium sp.]